MNKADIEIATFIFRSIQKYIEDGLTGEWIKHFIIDQNPEEFKKAVDTAIQLLVREGGELPF